MKNFGPICGGEIYSVVFCTAVGKIYTPIFSFFRKRVVSIIISDVRSVSNKRFGKLISHSIGGYLQDV